MAENAFGPVTPGEILKDEPVKNGDLTPAARRTESREKPVTESKSIERSCCGCRRRGTNLDKRTKPK